jgi:hypothetical protein
MIIINIILTKFMNNLIFTLSRNELYVNLIYNLFYSSIKYFIHVRPFFARSALPSCGVGDGMRKKDTEIPPKRAFI